MTDNIIVPTADAVITPTLEKLYEKDPSSFPHLNYRRGVYWHPIAGFRAQANRCLSRLNDEASRRRLSSATGTDLLEYVESEFPATPNVSESFAEGAVTIGRADLTLDLPAGDYPKGSIISRQQYTARGVLFVAAEYETLVDAHVNAGSTDPIAIPVRAKTTGTNANTPILLGNDSSQKIIIPNTVANMKVISFEAGGGALTGDDDFVRRFARISSRGADGPTADASKLGALSGVGVRRFLVYDDATRGVQKILVADANWGSSSRWAAIVQRGIYDADLVGFGCKVSTGPVVNRSIVVHATVSLRDGGYLAETTDIDVAIREAVASYFDDREDWNIWNESTLRAAISLAHNKILVCTDAKIFDAETGESIAEILTPDYSLQQLHLLLASNAMTISHVGPS